MIDRYWTENKKTFKFEFQKRLELKICKYKPWVTKYRNKPFKCIQNKIGVSKICN